MSLEGVSFAGPSCAGLSRDVIVAIPVKNEAERITGCLEALAAQRNADGQPIARFEVLLFVNNSDDGTAGIAAAQAPALGFPLIIREVTLTPGEASAGGARRHAMNEAARRLRERGGDGVLMTTDADSRVPPDWIARNLAAIAAGVDAVAGTVALDPEDERSLPETLKARGALEGRYEALVCELEARLDPQPHDPWPRHPTESGASLAVTLASFLAVGGVPDRALGEDRALVQALRQAGYRVRHAPDIVVITSGRLIGRAAGGCADTMRLRIEQPRVHCDGYLRPVRDILRAGRGAAGRAGPSPQRGLRPDQLPLQIALARATLTLLRLAPTRRGQPYAAVSQGSELPATRAAFHGKPGEIVTP